MPLLRTKTTTALSTQTSNYAGNSSTYVTKVYEQDIGSGVQKRLNWRRLPEPAKSSPLNYSKSWEKEDRGTLRYRHTESGPDGSSFYLYQDGPAGSLTPVNSEVPGVLGEAEYAAKVKLFNELKGEGANLANMLAERHQVAKSVSNVLIQLVNTVRDLRRLDVVSAVRRMGGDPRSAKRLRGKDIAGQWLSLQYGWKPLLSDTYDLVNGLHKRESTALKVFRCSSKYEMKSQSDSSWAYAALTGPLKCYGRRSSIAVCKYMIRAIPDLTLASPAALGFTNPLVVAWEVTPWSFVADWFLPVGRYLEQLSATHGWTFYDGCVSSLVKSNESAAYDLGRSYTSGGWTYSDSRSLQGASCSYVRFSRATLSGFPIPSLPKFKNPFSAAHVANATALLAQVMSGRKR